MRRDKFPIRWDGLGRASEQRQHPGNYGFRGRMNQRVQIRRAKVLERPLAFGLV
jgi:hypothetical protein